MKIIRGFAILVVLLYPASILHSEESRLKYNWSLEVTTADSEIKEYRVSTRGRIPLKNTKWSCTYEKIPPITTAGIETIAVSCRMGNAFTVGFAGCADFYELDTVLSMPLKLQLCVYGKTSTCNKIHLGCSD